uniref:BTB domain-containing protein n=1 Tax=Panagrellus redivivus TaxID=6233 RepID=A0A7E4VNP3_PANRE
MLTSLHPLCKAYLSHATITEINDNDKLGQTYPSPQGHTLKMTHYSGSKPLTRVQTQALQNAGILKALQHHGNEIIEINAGGKVYAVRYHILADTDSVYFKNLFTIAPNGQVHINPKYYVPDSSGRLFVDRDGKLFGLVLQFLRDGHHAVLPKDEAVLRSLRREAEYFGLVSFIAFIDNELQKLKSTVSETQQLIYAIQNLTQQLSGVAVNNGL